MFCWAPEYREKMSEETVLENISSLIKEVADSIAIEQLPASMTEEEESYYNNKLSIRLRVSF